MSTGKLSDTTARIIRLRDQEDLGWRAIGIAVGLSDQAAKLRYRWGLVPQLRAEIIKLTAEIMQLTRDNTCLKRMIIADAVGETLRRAEAAERRVAELTEVLAERERYV